MAYHYPHLHHSMVLKNKCSKTIKQMVFHLTLLSYKILVVLLKGVFLVLALRVFPFHTIFFLKKTSFVQPHFFRQLIVIYVI